MSDLENSRPANPAHCAAVLDSLADGCFAVDENFVVTVWNHAAERVTGVSRDAAVGRHCFDVFCADMCGAQCALRVAMRSREPVLGYPVSLKTADGRTRAINVSTAPLFDDDGRVVGGVESFRDVSATERAYSSRRRQHTFYGIIGESEPMRELFAVLPDIAESMEAVLLEGPSGSGKGVFARVIHDLSPRRDRPFVTVNCAALPETLLESELFGYRRGAFTDAKDDKPGRFDLADGGTIFLDEVSDIPLAVQAKLLRVLEEKTFEPLGGTATRTVDVRVIAATNQSLRKRVAAGLFRMDLFYRINIVCLEVPALRDRRVDIPLLVNYFIEKLNRERGRKVVGVSPDAMCALIAYDYPGNVRELENIIARAFILNKSNIIGPRGLPPELTHLSDDDAHDHPEWGPLERAEAETIIDALSTHSGHRERAAASLGIHKTTLIRKMNRLGITFDSSRTRR